MFWITLLLEKEKMCLNLEIIQIFGERYTILQLVDTLNEILVKNIKPVFEKERIGDVKHSLAGIEKAKIG